MGNMPAGSKAFIWKQRGSLGAVEFGSKMLPFLTASGMMSYMMEDIKISGAAARMILLTGLAMSFLAAFVLSFVIDRTRKKSGRCRPWIYSGIILFAVSILLSLHVPKAAAGFGTVYAGIVFFALCFSVRLLSYPVEALLAGMTGNTEERSNLASVKGFAGGLAGISAVFLAGRFTAPGLGGADGGRQYVMVFTVVILASMLIGSFFLKEAYLPPVPDSQRHGLKVYAEDFKAFFTDRYFLILLLYGGMLMFGTSVFSTLHVGDTYGISGGTGNAALVKGITYSVPLAAYLAVPFLTRKMTKRQCALLGTAVYGAACLLLLVSIKVLPVSYPALIMAEVGRGFMWAMLWAMEPDVFDHVDHDTGRARAVFPVAVISVVIGIGNSCAGVVRQCLTALAGNQGNLAEAAAQTDGRTSFIGIGFILIPLAVSGVLAFALRFYKLDEEYPEIRRELDRRYKKE